MMKATLVLILLLAGALGGCVGVAGPGAGLAGPASLLDDQGQFGALRLALVDEENTPIAGAQVALDATPLVAVTDEMGAAALAQVPPGKYTLFVGALGYASSAKGVEIVAGEITTLTVVLARLEAPGVLYHVVYHWSGFFDCALGSSSWISMCTWPYTATLGMVKSSTGVNLSAYGVPRDLQNNRFLFNLTIRPQIGQFVGELVWTPSSAAATQMLLMTMCGDYDPVPDECVGKIRYGERHGTTGTSPLRRVIDGTMFLPDGCHQVNPNATACKDSKYDLTQHAEVWVGNYVGLPFTQNPQLAFQQKYEVWNTVFYNGLGPDGWSVLTDA